jgi:hypothetical protein
MSGTADAPTNDAPGQPVVVKPAPVSNTTPPPSPWNVNPSDGFRSETIPGPGGRK